MTRDVLAGFGAIVLGVVLGVGAFRCTPKDEEAAAKTARDVCTVIVAGADAGAEDIVRQLIREIEAYEAEERLRALGRDGGVR